MGYSVHYADDLLSGDDLRSILCETQLLDDLPKIVADLVAEDKSKYCGAINHMLNVEGGTIPLL